MGFLKKLLMEAEREEDCSFSDFPEEATNRDDYEDRRFCYYDDDDNYDRYNDDYLDEVS